MGGNDSALKVDEPALGQWVRVFHNSVKNRKDILKKTVLTVATKKTFSLGQIPVTASLTVANAASQKSESLCPGFGDPLFQEECRQDPVFLHQVCALERMLRVKTRTEEEVSIADAAATAGVTAGTIGLREVHDSDLSESTKFAGAAAGAAATAGATGGTIGLLEAPEARVAATSGESVGITGLHQVIESARSSLIHESSLARSCADVGESCAAGVVSVSAALCVAALPAGRSLTYARAAANACGEVVSVSNSGRSDTVNSLRVQRSTSYNPRGVVAPNSRRKVRQSCTVGSRYAGQTADMSPARLLEHINGLPAQCMPSDRFLGNVWQKALV